MSMLKATALSPPAPVRAAVAGLPAAFEATFSIAVLAPLEEAVKVTSIVQEAPAARLLPQPLLWLKSAALVPDSVIAGDDSASDALPEFRSVMALADDGTPGLCTPKSSDEGLSVATGAAGVEVPPPPPPPQADSSTDMSNKEKQRKCGRVMSASL